MDKHLTGYFNNTRIRRHLRKAGLITRSGRIISEKEFRLNAMRRDHQRNVRECLAQAIFHKVLDMERHHQLETRRKLEIFARREQVYRAKVDHLRRTDEDIIPLFSPCPPPGPRSSHGHQVLAEEEKSESTESSSSPRPKTAPANMQLPTRLQPLHNTAAVGTAAKSSTEPNQKSSAYELDHPRGVDKDILMLMRAMNQSIGGPSPYQLPVINNFATPVPPPPKRSTKSVKNTRYGPRGRRFHSATAPNELDQLSPKDLGKFHKISVHSNVTIKMVYLGRSVHLCHDDIDYRDEIKALQQHCGGENLCVFKGMLLEGDTFQFTSKRHCGFPFSLTFYLNGLQVDRVSSCCEYRHRRGARLGGKHGLFRFISVEGASPCYRCIIAMGLDKKPSPPPKTQREGEESKAEVTRDEECGKGSKGGEEEEGNNKKSVSAASSSSHGADREMIEDKPAMEDEETVNEEIEDEHDQDEHDQGQSTKDEYEEDFEAYEEKQDEKTDDGEQADDKRDGKSEPLWGDEKGGLDREMENKILSQRASEASDVSEKDDGDRYSASESEQEDKQDRTKRLSISSCSTLYSSTSGDESEVKKPVDAKGASNNATHTDYEKQPELYSDVEGEALIDSEESADENSQRRLADSIEEEEPEVTTEKTMTVEDVPMKDLQEWQLGTDRTRGEIHNLRLIENMTWEETEESILIPTDEDRTERKFEIEGIKMQKSFEVDDRSDRKLVQEKIAQAIVIAEDVNSEPEPSDSSTDEDDNLINSGYGLTERKVDSEEEWIAEELLVSKTEMTVAQPKVDETLKKSNNLHGDIKEEAGEQVVAEKSGALGKETVEVAASSDEGMTRCPETVTPVDVAMLKDTSYEGVENAVKGVIMVEQATKEAMTNGDEPAEKATGLAEEPKHEYGKIIEEPVDRVSEAMVMGDEISETILKREIVDGYVTVEEVLAGNEQENAVGAATFLWWEEVVEESASKRERRETAQIEETAEEASTEREESVIEKTYELAEVLAEADQGIEISSDKSNYELQETRTNAVEVRTSTARTELELMLDEASHERKGMPSGDKMTKEIVVDNKPCGADVNTDTTFMSDGEEIAVEAESKLQELVKEAAIKGDKTMEEYITEEEVTIQETATEIRKSTTLEQETEVARDEDTSEKVVAGEAETVKEEAVLVKDVKSELTEFEGETAAAEALSNGEYVEEEAALEKEKLTETLLEFNEEKLAKAIEHECEKESMEATPEELETEASMKREAAAEEAARKGEMEIEEAAVEGEGEGTLEEFKSTSDEMPDQEEAVYQSDEIEEETLCQIKKEAEGTISDTEEEGQEVVSEKEEGISEREEEAEKVVPAREELSEERTPEKEEVPEKIVPESEKDEVVHEREEAAEERTPERDKGAEKVVPERDEVAEERTPEREEVPEKVVPESEEDEVVHEREEAAEERTPERDKEAEKVVPERKKVSEERTPEREAVPEKVVPERDEDEVVTMEEDLVERKLLKERVVSEEEEEASTKTRLLQRQNSAEALMLEGEEAAEQCVHHEEAMGERTVSERNEATEGIVLDEEKEVKASPEEEEEQVKQVEPKYEELTKEVAIKKDTVEEAVGDEGFKAITPKRELMAMDTSLKEDAAAEGKAAKKNITAEDKGEEMFEEPEYEHKSSTEKIVQNQQEAVGKMVFEGEQVERVTVSAEQQLSDQAELGGSEMKEALIEKAIPTGKLSTLKEIIDDEHLGPEEMAPNTKESVKETSETEEERLSNRQENMEKEEQIDNKVALEDVAGREETSVEETPSCSENKGKAEPNSMLKDLSDIREAASTSEKNKHEMEFATVVKYDSSQGQQYLTTWKMLNPEKESI
nr:glutamate-rich protein 3 isoform X2 [Geotrypetes seraphini]XP_033772290.1 glutamate-rich protein 3 isoform X2 [Geotrypetes seraphini]